MRTQKKRRKERGIHPAGEVRAYTIYSAGALALTDPGPAAAGVVIVAPLGRAISQRAYYLGNAGQQEAAARAILAALRLGQSLGLAPLRLAVESEALVDLIAKKRPLIWVDGAINRALIDLCEELPILDAKLISPDRNPARIVAFRPLMRWLPERTRRAHDLEVRLVRPGVYEVASETRPGHFYRVHLPNGETVSANETIRCECADFQYRGVPCKHLLIAAAETGKGQESLFYPEAADGAGIPCGAADASPLGTGLQRTADEGR